MGLVSEEEYQFKLTLKFLVKNYLKKTNTAGTVLVEQKFVSSKQSFAYSIIPQLVRLRQSRKEYDYGKV